MQQSTTSTGSSRPRGRRAKTPDNVEEYIDAFGTLAIREDGAATFYGRSAGSESLLAGEVPRESGSQLPSPTIPQTMSSIASVLGPSVLRRQDSLPIASNGSLASFTASFPFSASSGNLPGDIDLDALAAQLPQFQETQRLCELYLAQAPWFFGAVTRAQLTDEILPLWFPEDAPRPNVAPAARGISPPPVGTAHDLALLYVILCFGALGDVNVPFPTASPDPSSSEDFRPSSSADTLARDSGYYYRLTKASLTLEPVLEGPPSVSTVQTLALMAIYEGLSAGENSIESTWAIFGLSTKLAQSIGLHRDCARWGLKPAEVQKRRALFWELFITDCWQALATGRLPTFSLPFVDCELPQDVDETISEDGKPQSSFPYWKARFGAECVSAVVQGTLTSRAPRYSIILELDRKVRDMELPKYAGGTPPEDVGLAQTMSHYMATNYRHWTLLYIHRCFFAHAIQNHPNDPIKSPYAPSFLAGYRSACDLLSSIRTQFKLFPAEIARFWVLWTHGFSSAIMLSSVVTHATRSKVARAALLELGKACELFEAAAQLCPGSRAGKFLPILQRVSKRAATLFEDACNGAPASIPNDIFEPSKSDGANDELSIFSGKTHTLTTTKAKKPAAASTKASQNAPSPPTARSLSDSPEQTQIIVDNPSFAGVHPNLVKELNVFDGTLNAQIQNGYASNGMYAQQAFAQPQPPSRPPPTVVGKVYDSYASSPISPSHPQTPALMHSTSQRSLRQAYQHQHAPPPPPPSQQIVHSHTYPPDVSMQRPVSHSRSHRDLRQPSYEEPQQQYNVAYKQQQQVAPPMAGNGHGHHAHTHAHAHAHSHSHSPEAMYMDTDPPATPTAYQASQYWQHQQPARAYDPQHQHQQQQHLRQINLQIDPHYGHYTPDAAMRGIATEDPAVQEHWQNYMHNVGSPRMIQNP
ncbi:Fungal-trans domain-containing protein [Mycena kentingensis (nom. inval.)]|nr:Fungal-trans domain-containing protein [Mycena kentingensis (nom. inval.)]